MRERIVFRFGATLVANLLRAALSFLSGIMIARGLGASGYGDLNFLLGSFAAISQLLDVGTSSAFYTFISQRRRSRTFVLLYSGWMLIQFAVTALAVALLLPSNLIQRIWVGHQRGIVLLAFGASFMMTQLWGMVSALGEATRKTVFIQLTAVAQAVAHLALVAILIRWGWLTVSLVLWLLVGEYILLAIFLGPSLWRWNLTEQPAGNEGYRTILREFAAYCGPLVIYAWVSFLYTFADRWLLQQYGGSEQQGFFAVGQQVANISLIATTSILRVFWKEVAEARDRKDHQRVRKLYVSVARSLYFAGAGLSCLFIPYSRQILIWTVGISYERAWLCLALMFLFPIHQSLGQIQGALFYASSETKSYVKIGFLMMGVSIPVTYFVLAPRSALIAGLGLGAAGLAVKMVVLQIGGVSLQSYVIARTNGWSYDYSYQAIVLGMLLSLGWACKWAGGALPGLSGSVAGPVKVILLGGSFYAAGLLILLYCWPEIAGLTRGEARHMVSDTARWLRSTVA